MTTTWVPRILARAIKRTANRRQLRSMCTTTNDRKGRVDENEDEEEDRRKRPENFEMFSYDEDKVFVLGHFPGGFKINNRSMEGPIMVLPNFCMRWAVSSLADITPDSAVIATLIHPVPEVVVLGVGPESIPPLDDRADCEHSNLRVLQNSLRDQGSQLEILDTVSACATFNVLNAENRRVAGAFLPVRW